MRGSWLGSGCVVAVMAAGCGAEGSWEEPSVLQQEHQCGPTWDAQGVEQYDGTLGVTSAWVERHEGAVGFQTSEGCSGTLISDDLFLSAGHCEYATGDIVMFNIQEDPGGVLRTPQAFTVTEVLEQQYTATLDFAIVRLGGSPGQTFGFARIADRDEAVGNDVVLIQHPDWGPKVLHAGPVVSYPSPWFTYQVDTTGGTSGAGVLSTDGFLVGIHKGGSCQQMAPIGSNAGMRMTALLDHSLTMQGVLAAQRGGHGFVLANQKTAASYTPVLNRNFNTSGASNTVTKLGTGVYTVRFPNIGGSGVSGNGRGGNPHVVSTGGVTAYCKVAGWSALISTNVDVEVHCFRYNGVAENTEFAAFFNRSTFEGFADEHGTSAYLFSQSATYTSPTSASAAYSWNDANETSTITQTATGEYDVFLPGIDNRDASAHVTAFGPDSLRCQVRSWSAAAGGATVRVVCTTPAGAKANSRFTLSFGVGGVPARLDAAAGGTAYAFTNSPSSPSYTPSTSFQGNTMGGDLTATRLGAGQYLVNIPRPGFTVTKDTALVTAFGSTGQHCNLVNWDRFTDYTRVQVWCTNASGVWSDQSFTLSYLTSTADPP